jgi:hypothetical protein
VLPLTLKLDNVPTEVTFGCAAVVNVPVNNVADTLAASMLPVTFNVSPTCRLPVVARYVALPVND